MLWNIIPFVGFFYFFIKQLFSADAAITEKKTEAWWDIFMTWKIDFGLLAVAWAGLWNKMFGPIMSNFWGRFFQLFVGKKKKKKKIENILASALKSCIEKR